METGLFEIQAHHLSGLRRPSQVRPGSQEVVYALFRRTGPVGFDPDPTSHGSACETEDVPSCMKSVEPVVNPTIELARCFLRLTNLPNCALDRLSRYEAPLWRQAGQILFALDVLGRRKPWDRRRFPVGSRQEPPVYDPEEC